MTRTKLGFGLRDAVPDDVKTAWGARLIAPNDLLHDRQDLVAENDEAKAELIEWLNGGAIRKALDWLSDERYPDGLEFFAYNDADGVIVGNTNSSGGYVYLAGWLKPDRHEARKQAEILRELRRETEIGKAHDALTVETYSVERVPIEEERWHTHYGWSKARPRSSAPPAPRSACSLCTATAPGASWSPSPVARLSLSSATGALGRTRRRERLSPTARHATIAHPPTCRRWSPRCLSPPGARPRRWWSRLRRLTLG